MDGGSGNDTLVGNTGPDRMIGGPDDDDFDGGAGNDIMCDTTGTTGLCASVGGHLFIGGDGNDTIWYDMTASCTTNVNMDLSSDAGGAGAFNDTCGNSDDWTGSSNVDWPDSCEVPTNIEPNQCTPFE